MRTVALKFLRVSTRAYSTLGPKFPQKQQKNVAFFVASSTVLGVSLYILNQKPIYNDAKVNTSNKVNINLPPERQNGLSVMVWGSNYNRLIDPDQSPNTCFKTPTYIPNLFSSPLKDLAFSVDHAACVDASGDVYQWGDGFFGTGGPVENRHPQLTLRGKNIISLAITPKKIFALSDSGRVFVLSSSQNQLSNVLPPSSWWSFFNSADSQPYFSELDTDVPLHSAERISSISAGTDHLLALTTHGRVFAHPVTRHANRRGQLGVRKISIQNPTDASKRIPVELNPAMPSDERRLLNVVEDSITPEDPINDKRVGYCDRLFEVPALRGVEIGQIATGDRTSFAVTRQQGRVLGWGANEFGQLGFGSNVTVPLVSVPTEVVLNKFTKRGAISRCLNIAAEKVIWLGGDLTYFVVERDLASTEETNIFDVLASGNGQWGGLGNGTYSNCQGEPVKVKNISGLMEYDESNNSLTPLRPYHISVAPGPIPPDTGLAASTSGHVIAMLDTLPLAGNETVNEVAYSPGRDVITWGLNQHYQLGNGKRSSSNIPLSVRASDGEGRFMCQVGQGTIKDFRGRVVKRKGNVEQRALAGPGFSVIFWKVL